MKPQPVLSVIIPFYNVSPYLEELFACIKTHKKVEWIFVEDCSTDNTLALLRQQIASSRLENCRLIVHEKNRGLGGARNTGIDAASGKYLTFIDSDDTFSEDYISRILEDIAKHAPDIILPELHYFNAEKQLVWKAPVINGIAEGRKGLMLLSQDKILPNAFKVYRRELFKDYRFVENLYYEDIEFNPRVFAHAGKIIPSAAALYYHLRNNQSITRQKTNSKHVNDFVFALNSITTALTACNEYQALWNFFIGRWKYLLLKAWTLEGEVTDMALKAYLVSVEKLISLCPPDAHQSQELLQLFADLNNKFPEQAKQKGFTNTLVQTYNILLSAGAQQLASGTGAAKQHTSTKMSSQYNTLAAGIDSRIHALRKEVGAMMQQNDIIINSFKVVSGENIYLNQRAAEAAESADTQKKYAVLIAELQAEVKKREEAEKALKAEIESKKALLAQLQDTEKSNEKLTLLVTDQIALFKKDIAWYEKTYEGKSLWTIITRRLF
jgi:glycosyltransferase involved in cell wall biosynthesis